MSQQNTLFDKHSNDLQSLSDNLFSTFTDGVNKSTEQISIQTNDVISSIHEADKKFRESVPLAISQFDENVTTRKMEIEKAVAEVQACFKEQLNKQDEIFQKEIKAMRSKQNRKFIIFSLISILISSGIAGILSTCF